MVQKVAADNANIIFGAVHDEAMEDAVKVTVIATGIKNEKVSLSGRSGPSAAVRTAQQSVKNMLAKRDNKVPGETVPTAPAPPPRITPAGLPADDLDVPAFIRRAKAVAAKEHG